MYHLSFDIDFKRNTYPGKLIAIDGLDGSGKTTQAHMLVKNLKKEGRDVLYTKEPTDEPTGQFIRKVLSGEIKVPPVTFQYLFSADRAVHQEHVTEWLKEGKIVVTDRYFWSAVAYGIADRGVNGDYLLVALSILSMYHQFLQPDLTLYLDIDPVTAMKRIDKSREGKEIYEQKDKLIKIQKGYDFLLEKFPSEFTIVDGKGNIEEVANDILKRVKPLVSRNEN